MREPFQIAEPRVMAHEILVVGFEMRRRESAKRQQHDPVKIERAASQIDYCVAALVDARLDLATIATNAAQ